MNGGNLPLSHPSRRRVLILGSALGALYGIFARLVSESERFAGAFTAMSLSFLFLVPLAIGYLAVQPIEKPSWMTRLFAPWFPRAISAELSDQRIGGIRHARFEGGVVFVETIIEFSVGQRLSFTIDPLTGSIPPTTLDPHVLIGVSSSTC